MIKSNLVKKINSYGEVLLDENELVEEILHGNKVDNVFIDDEDAVNRYERSLTKIDVDGFPNIKVASRHKASSDEYLARQSLNWKVPSEYMYMDIECYLKGLCRNDRELSRVQEELEEFKKRDELDILRVMKYIVDTFRKNNVLWGVGRGSSVSSFCLFLIGINKIDPLKYDIPYTEYFKEKEKVNG